MMVLGVQSCNDLVVQIVDPAPTAGLPAQFGGHIVEATDGKGDGCQQFQVGRRLDPLG
jgi:hypothetical protein